MFVPAPIDKNFVPCGNRRMLRRHASIIIDGTGGKGGGGIPRVVPQQACISYCKDQTTDGLRCGANCAGSCQGPVCVLPY